MRFLRLLSLVAVVSAVAVMASTAVADPITYTAVLSGSQENPPRQTNATGFGTIVLNGNQATISVTFSGINTGISLAHIHQSATVGANGGVIIDFAGLFTPGANAGSFTTTVTLTASQITALNAGLLYFNVHSPQFPGGEIRGNINPVPEPGTMALLGTGLAMAAARLRKRRKPDSE